MNIKIIYNILIVACFISYGKVNSEPTAVSKYAEQSTTQSCVLMLKELIGDLPTRDQVFERFGKTVTFAPSDKNSETSITLIVYRSLDSTYDIVFVENGSVAMGPYVDKVIITSLRIAPPELSPSSFPVKVLDSLFIGNNIDVLKKIGEPLIKEKVNFHNKKSLLFCEYLNEEENIGCIGFYITENNKVLAVSYRFAPG